MIRHCILSMDGTAVSGGSGLVTAALLVALRALLDAAGDRRPLLEQVDIFAGTSAGAFNALYLASFEHPDDGLRELGKFWAEVTARNRDGFSLLRALAVPLGQSSLLASKPMRDYFLDVFGSKLRLGDLHHGVVITTFALDDDVPPLRTWKPKVFHNTGRRDDPDLELRVVDVALRSGSPPLLYPIYQGIDHTGGGFVDGGVWANNPAIVALAQAIRNLVHGDDRHPECMDRAADLSGLLLLSLGNGRVPYFLAPRFRDGVANWGFSEWLLDVHHPFALITMMLEAGVQAADFQARYMLQHQYMRINPVLDAKLAVDAAKDVAPAMQRVAALPSTQAELAAALTWLERSGWLDARPGDRPGIDESDPTLDDPETAARPPD